MSPKDHSRWMFRRKVPLKGDSGEQGALGPQGTTGPTGATGPAGPAGVVNVVSVSTPVRVFGTPFQPHGTRPVQCTYSIQQACTVTLGGDIETTVDLRSDAANPPTVVRARAKLRSALGLGVGVGQTTEHIVSLTYMVPAGHWVNLVATTEAGSTAAISAQCEEVLS